MLQHLTHIERAEAFCLLNELADDSAHYNEFFCLNKPDDIAGLKRKLGLTKRRIERAVEHLATEGLVAVSAVDGILHVGLKPRGYNTWAIHNGKRMRFSQKRTAQVASPGPFAKRKTLFNTVR